MNVSKKVNAEIKLGESGVKLHRPTLSTAPSGAASPPTRDCSILLATSEAAI
jgi:hypothetical protein